MADGIVNGNGKRQLLNGRKLYVPQMSHGGAVAFAAAFRSIGTEAEVRPDSDERTLESRAMLAAYIKNHIQHKDEHRLIKVFEEDFRGYEEPSIQRIFQYSEPYRPHEGALGEMTLSVGKAVFHYHQGCGGVVDVSPFSCMNGIVTQAIYPQVSSDHDDIPIRNFFFDGTQTDLDRDVGIFMELARSYRARKKRLRP